MSSSIFKTTLYTTFCKSATLPFNAIDFIDLVNYGLCGWKWITLNFDCKKKKSNTISSWSTQYTAWSTLTWTWDWAMGMSYKLPLQNVCFLKFWTSLWFPLPSPSEETFCRCNIIVRAMVTHSHKGVSQHPRSKSCLLVCLFFVFFLRDGVARCSLMNVNYKVSTSFISALDLKLQLVWQLRVLLGCCGVFVMMPLLEDWRTPRNGHIHPVIAT